MNRLILLFILTVCNICVNAQENLVYNGDFESRTQCPDGLGQVYKCNGWWQYTNGSSDYFSTCTPTGPGVGPTAPANYFGNQMPLSGECYMGGWSFSIMGGFFTTATEYIGGKLKEPLQPGTAYEVSFSISSADILSGVGHNSLGVYFYKDAPDTILTANTLVSIIPQVTYFDSGCVFDIKKWIRMVSEFVADSAYENLVIGQFNIPGKYQYFQYPGAPGASYYYYDSVFVRVARLNNLFNDSSLCIGQTFQVPFSLEPGTKIFTGNVYTAQLSDTAGSFVNNTTDIGTLVDTAAGVINCVIPDTVTPGTKYRIRVVSSKPVRISNDNGKDIRVDRAPDVIVTSTTPLCEGDSLKLTADAGITNVTYLWEGPNGFTSNKNNDTITGVSMAADGKYILTTKYYKCTAYDTATVQIKHRPIMPKLESNSPLSVGDILRLKITNPEDNVEYTWSGPLKFNSTSTSPEIKGLTRDHEGIYKVLATQNGCSSNSMITVIVGEASSTSYTLYPNPNNGDFTFSATAKADQYISLRIYNSAGQVVYKERAQTQNKKLTLNIKLRDALSSDVYTLRMMIDGKQLAAKFTVNRGH